MKKKIKQKLIMGLAILFAVASHHGNGLAESPTSAAAVSAKLQQRIDFGNAYIMGQSIKSGSVYLMNRKQSEIKSMLEYREDYRREILEDFRIQDSPSDGSQAKKQDKDR